MVPWATHPAGSQTGDVRLKAIKIVIIQEVNELEILCVCIFCKCGPNRTSFKKKAHIIPRFLGSDITLQSAYECDKCNESFGKNIEQHVAKEEFGFFRALLNIPRITSKGRTIPAPNFGDNGLKVKPGDRNNFHSRNLDFIIEVVEEANSEIKLDFDILDKKLHFSWQRRNVCNLVSRLLSKMLIEATAEVHGSRDVFSSEFEPHRNNALGRVGKPDEFIPYSVEFIPGGVSGAFICLMPLPSLALVFFAGVTAYFMPLHLNGAGYLERYGFKRVQPKNIPSKIQQHIA